MPGTPEHFHGKQRLFFQVSGQVPYSGPEKIPSAIDRYVNKILRVSGARDRALEGKSWLVCGKYSYAVVVLIS